MIHHLSETVSYPRALYIGPGRVPVDARPGPAVFRFRPLTW
ncbi:hypothetical protein ACFVHW_27490 [Streptomyces sp. NPDC127110]